jgi:hypothetical protein
MIKLSLLGLLAAIAIPSPVTNFVEAAIHHGYTEAGNFHITLYKEQLEEAEKSLEKAEASPEYREKNKAELVAAQALTWKGVDFKKGVSARCADFVRHVLALEGIDIPVAKGSLGPLMADSFYNPDAGIIIKDPNYLRPGDIVMFHETYNGGGRILPGAKGNRRITHVGIYVGDGMMIDRSTRSRPVNYRSIHHNFGHGGSHFHSALRPNAYKEQ